MHTINDVRRRYFRTFESTESTFESTKVRKYFRTSVLPYISTSVFSYGSTEVPSYFQKYNVYFQIPVLPEVLPYFRTFEGTEVLSYESTKVLPYEGTKVFRISRYTKGYSTRTCSPMILLSYFRTKVASYLPSKVASYGSTFVLSYFRTKV